MVTEIVDRSVRLSDIGRIIRRNAALFVTIVVLAVAAGAAYGVIAPKEYTATATLVVSPITTNPFSTTAATQTINISTEREILLSSEVARIASESLGQEISADSTLLNQVDVAAPSGSQILQVSVEASTPDSAADSANAMANAYLTFRAEGAREVAVSFIAAIDAQLAELQGEDDATSRGTVATLQEQRASLAVVGDNPGRVIGSAIPPASPSSLGLPVFVVAGLAAGLVLALIVVIIWNQINPRVRYRERLEGVAEREFLPIRSPADLEGFRWLLRTADDAMEDRRSPAPSIAVFSSDSASAGSVVRSMAAAAVSDGRSVVMYLSDDFDSDDLGWGWPDAEAFKDFDDDLVLIDGGNIDSGARRATLADRVTISIAVATTKSRMTDVRALIENLQRSASAIVLPIFLARPRPIPVAPAARSDAADTIKSAAAEAAAPRASRGRAGVSNQQAPESDESRSGQRTAESSDEVDRTEEAGTGSETSDAPESPSASSRPADAVDGSDRRVPTFSLRPKAARGAVGTRGTPHED